jgi:hypothetical protein
MSAASKFERGQTDEPPETGGKGNGNSEGGSEGCEKEEEQGGRRDL